MSGRPKCEYYKECKERCVIDPEMGSSPLPNTLDPKWWTRSLCDGCYEYREALTQETKPEPQWAGKQWDMVTQLRDEVKGWREQHARIMLELDKKKKNSYQYE